jgi:hypothetical protein
MKQPQENPGRFTFEVKAICGLIAPDGHLNPFGFSKFSNRSGFAPFNRLLDSRMDARANK